MVESNHYDDDSSSNTTDTTGLSETTTTTLGNLLNITQSFTENITRFSENITHNFTDNITQSFTENVTQNFTNIISLNTTQSSVSTLNLSSTTEISMEDDEQDFPENIAYPLLWKIFPPIIFTVGLTGNTLTLCVVKRLGIKNQPTLVFIAFLAITDTVVLCTGLPNYWISYTFDFSIRSASDANCRLYLFFIYVSMQYSSWILTSVSVERLIKTYFPFRYRRLFDTKKAVIGLVVILVLLCVIDGHLLITNGVNDYTEGDCGSLTEAQFWFDEKVFVYIDFTVLSALPFLIMLICNIFISRILRKIQIERRSMIHRVTLKRANRVSIKMTKMLLVCTSFFLVATAPISVYFIVDSYLTPKYVEQDDLKSQARMDLAWTISYLLQFFSYSVNFYLYTAVNSRFLQELKALIHCKPSLRKMRMYSQRNQTSSIRRTLEYTEPTSIGLDKSLSDETTT